MIIAAVTVVFSGVLGCGDAGSGSEVDASYVEEIKAWHEERIERLRKPTSWLSLVGLFWLKEGENTFGSAESNRLVFPKGRAPDRLGTMTLTDGAITVEIAPGVTVTHDGQPVQSMTMHHDQDADHKVTVLEAGSLSWYAIKRGDRIGIRLKDKESEGLRNFEGIDTFPIDAQWRVDATLEPHDPPRTISIVNVLGDESQEPTPGTLTFEMGGRTHTLVPIGEPADDKLFLVFGDKSNGRESYGGGRFLVVDAPGDDGRIVIDFNKAYNPPCAFSPFATCPLPPEENQLSIAVTAGEKTYGHH
ncbi:MAG: DUF1684 domain-containing protein [Candidatus Latescibacterota bacterium]|nr:MAG: DUF1684 domain-containing protein [Candidatus Latescibacterota bacterium]